MQIKLGMHRNSISRSWKDLCTFVLQPPTAAASKLYFIKTTILSSKKEAKMDKTPTLASITKISTGSLGKQHRTLEGSQGNTDS